MDRTRHHILLPLQSWVTALNTCRVEQHRPEPRPAVLTSENFFLLFRPGLRSIGLPSGSWRQSHTLKKVVAGIEYMSSEVSPIYCSYVMPCNPLCLPKRTEDIALRNKTGRCISLARHHFFTASLLGSVSLNPFSYARKRCSGRRGFTYEVDKYHRYRWSMCNCY